MVVGFGFEMSFCGSEEFVTYRSLPFRLFYYYMCMTAMKMMYYVPWCITDAACIACGLSYNGKKLLGGVKRDTWDYIVGVYILGVELEGTPLKMMANWNHQIHQWLKNHVQLRLVKPGQKPNAIQTLTVFTVSSLWHGFYPFYFIMFFQAACLTELSKDLFRSRSLFSFIPKQVSPIVANVASMSAMNYLGTAFCLLTFEKGFNFMRGTYSLGFILIPGLLIVSRLINLPQIAKKMQKQVQEPEKKDK
mmetsp:Transcript_11453/g.19371  ORF Transcript_11453/g.19371 Transcript_11453/m.19371 type:complete len:248 (-) Transcript_11453:49-792(-)